MQIRLIPNEYVEIPAGTTWKFGDMLPPPGSLITISPGNEARITHYRYRNDLPATVLSQAVVEVYVEGA